MALQSLEWRRQYRIDTLLDDFTSPEVFRRYFAAGFVGVDQAHNPRKYLTGNESMYFDDDVDAMGLQCGSSATEKST